MTLLVIAADVATLAALSVLTGITSPEVWTSDLMADALFLIPLIAAAQLDPVINAVMAIPTVAAFLVTCAVTKTLNEEPWTSIALNTLVLAALCGAPWRCRSSSGTGSP